MNATPDEQPGHRSVIFEPQSYLGRAVAGVFADRLLGGWLSEPRLSEGRTYFGARALGVSFLAEAGPVETVHLYVEADEEYDAYRLDLPYRLRPTMSRAQVRKLLGRPRASGDPLRLPVLGVQGAWDLFDVDEAVCLHVSYRLNGPGLTLLTFMLPEAVPV